MNHAAIRKEITERLTKYWDFSEVQLADPFIFHLVKILILLAGQFGYVGQFAPTIHVLRQALGDDQVFDRPSELRAKSNTSDTEPTREEKEFVN